MNNCKYCGSERLKKDGIRGGAQKWRCKDCNRSQGEIDRRKKYEEKEKKVALKLYLEGNGFRCIARLSSEIFEKKFWHQTVYKWIKEEGLKAKKEQKKQANQVDNEIKVDILEMDELFTFIKKKQIKSEYGQQ